MTYSNTRLNFPTSTLRLAIALLATAAIALGIISPTLILRAEAQRPSVNRLNEDQRILHVLNRLGYGARPGDVERVKAMGLDNYIKQQLNPRQIDDSAAEAKLKNLPTLNMTTAELYEKYPQPQQLVRQLQRRGDLPADLDLQKLQAGGAQQGPPPKPGEAMPGEAMSAHGSEPGNEPACRC